MSTLLQHPEHPAGPWQAQARETIQTQEAQAQAAQETHVAHKALRPARIHPILSSSWIRGLTYTPHGVDSLGRPTGILTLCAVHNGIPSLIIMHEVPAYTVGLLRAADGCKLKGRGDYSVGRLYHRLLKSRYLTVEQKHIDSLLVQTVFNAIKHKGETCE
jgi:hypothetical protein